MERLAGPSSVTADSSEPLGDNAARLGTDFQDATGTGSSSYNGAVEGNRWLRLVQVITATESTEIHAVHRAGL